jgi:hypothetical protein
MWNEKFEQEARRKAEVVLWFPGIPDSELGRVFERVVILRPATNPTVILSS